MILYSIDITVGLRKSPKSVKSTSFKDSHPLLYFGMKRKVIGNYNTIPIRPFMPFATKLIAYRIHLVERNGSFSMTKLVFYLFNLHRKLS